MTVELAMRGVHAGYGQVEVLHGLDLAFPAGTLTALLGPNGAGKTTTLSVLSGELEASAGRIEWAGKDVTDTTAYERARAGMVLIPERRGIFPTLSVRENLEVFAGGRDPALFQPALDTFPVLAPRLRQRAGSLSGGEQQMLALARAVLHRPRVLLLDELSLGLAPRIIAQLFEVVAELARTSTTVVMVEQYLGEALRMAEVVYILGRGSVVFAGEPGELRDGPLPGYAISRRRS
jgi:branched-chain amino acid transport system ATP-binding protein